MSAPATPRGIDTAPPTDTAAARSTLIVASLATLATSDSASRPVLRSSPSSRPDSERCRVGSVSARS